MDAPKRVKYYQGRLMTAEELNDLQAYLHANWQLTNRILLGVCVVEGLELSLKDGKMRISAGIAFDCAGRAVRLTEDVVIDAGHFKDGDYVCLQYVEEEVKVKYDLENWEEYESSFNTRIEEKVNVIIEFSDFEESHMKAGNGFKACGGEHSIPIGRIEKGQIVRLF